MPVPAPADQTDLPAAEAETAAVLESVESTEAPAAAAGEDQPQDQAQQGTPAAEQAPEAEAAPTAEEPTAAPAAPSAPKPAAVPQPPTPGVPSPASLPKPAQRPGGSGAKGAGKSGAKPAAAPLVAPAYSTPLEEAAQFARVSEDGHVTLLDNGEEVQVGQYPDATEQEALAYFVRKYDDVVSQTMLLEQRVAAGAPAGEIQKTLDHLQDTVEARGMVGDLPTLRDRLAALQDTLDERRTADKAALEAAQAEQLAVREGIVAEAEDWAAKDPHQVQWKQASARMAELFDQWKAAQKAGPRLGKSVEDGLWKRFRAARTTFDKHRRAFFSQLDATNAEAKSVKEKLIARAEKLSSSTDWGPTTAAYRDLMDEWKAAPRASRKEDDALWARFRGAQDTFFAARKAANDEIDREYGDNLKVKEQILAEGQKLLPFTDLKAGRAALNDLRGRWEDAGRVPRKDISRMESGFRKLEEALKQAEDEHWQKTNPETQARTSSAVSQLQETIAGLEKDLEQAQAQGDQKKITQAQEALDARRQWLEMLQASQS
ncbi:DUF349 domain-containing protein [Micrococcus terreus]|nr:DUF349 domain-containing protein [Micrococcus terreus]MDK7700241.1 DUF349 domain-containing protein [Micrococcus terreus]WOO98917.1 DUF349 domain-containing protein [Micrococcus terreus]